MPFGARELAAVWVYVLLPFAARRGLLRAGAGCTVSPLAVFVPADTGGTVRPVELGDGCQIGPFAVIFGGTRTGNGARVEEHVIVGRPEQGYAVGHVYPGAGADTVIEDGAVIRAGAVIYAGTKIGENTVVGHHTLLRSFVTVGSETQLGHNLTIERATQIGRLVRCSPGSHVTSSCVLADRVFLGAGVRTVNDKEMSWRDPDGREPALAPPVFSTGARVGSGSVILAGVSIGRVRPGRRGLSPSPRTFPPGRSPTASQPASAAPQTGQSHERREPRCQLAGAAAARLPWADFPGHPGTVPVRRGAWQAAERLPGHADSGPRPAEPEPAGGPVCPGPVQVPGPRRARR